MTVWLRKASLQRVASDSWHHRAEAAAQWQAGSGHRLVDFWKEQEVRTSQRLGFQDPDGHRLDESFFFLAAFSLFTTLINCYKWCLIHVKKKKIYFFWHLHKVNDHKGHKIEVRTLQSNCHKMKRMIDCQYIKWNVLKLYKLWADSEQNWGHLRHLCFMLACGATCTSIYRICRFQNRLEAQDDADCEANLWLHTGCSQQCKEWWHDDSSFYVSLGAIMGMKILQMTKWLTKILKISVIIGRMKSNVWQMGPENWIAQIYSLKKKNTTNCALKGLIQQTCHFKSCGL